VRVLIIAFIFLAGGALAVLLVKTRLFGAFSIVREPYYRTVVAQIVSDPKFRAKLGTPIEVDDGGVWCNYIKDSPVMSQANCDIPARGPRAAGDVHAQIVSTPGALDVGLWLHVGTSTIESGS
jgi:hypothetical protein